MIILCFRLQIEDWQQATKTLLFLELHKEQFVEKSENLSILGEEIYVFQSWHHLFQVKQDLVYLLKAKI